MATQVSVTDGPIFLFVGESESLVYEKNVETGDASLFGVLDIVIRVRNDRNDLVRTTHSAYIFFLTRRACCPFLILKN